MTVQLDELDRDGGVEPRMFGGVLEPFEAAEVDRRLDGLRMPRESVRADGHREPGLRSGLTERGGGAVLAQDAWHAPVRGVADVVQRLVDLVPEVLQHRPPGRPAGCGSVKLAALPPARRSRWRRASPSRPCERARGSPPGSRRSP